MNTKQYQTVQLQLENEKNELLQEISTLLQRKKQVEQKKEHELNVFRSRNKPALENTSTVAGVLMGDGFSTERMKQLNNEIKKIDEFIHINEMKVERLKEKESTIVSLYEEGKMLEQKELDKKEEKQLLDLKMVLNN